MEWVDGFRLTDDPNMNLYKLNKSKMVDTLVQCSLKQILENGTVYFIFVSTLSRLVVFMF
jgi:predicted unusual protein kinase regulating ubiquinone biosynthesis (AarF/ABC1/UbiB family)